MKIVVRLLSLVIIFSRTIVEAWCATGRDSSLFLSGLEARTSIRESDVPTLLKGAYRLSRANQHSTSTNAQTVTEGKTGVALSTSSKLLPAILDIERIKAILPHRYPFLLIDKVLHFEPGVKAVGVKQVTANEDHFNGHFPSRAIMPGVLQIEALAQLCGIVCLQQPVSDGVGNFYFASIDGVKWKRPVVPGDTLILEAELLAWRPSFGIAKMTGNGYVDGELVLSVKELVFAFVKDKTSK